MNTIFSGIQPTGNLHLGNYLGAITNWVKLQLEFNCIYCIVDLHAITVYQDPLSLKSNTREVAATLIAAGIDAKKSIIFNQSQVPAHSELAWIFNCISKLGWLNRMTQFKDKVGKNREKASSGLFVYPNLMAADILLYKASHVPVGDDQKQHLELTRDIAISFNSQYKINHFPIVEPIIIGEATRVMSLRDGMKKMSKSDSSDFTRINICDSPDQIASKIRKAKTDSDPIPDNIDGLINRPEASNLIGIFAELLGSTKLEIINQYSGSHFSKFKESLVEIMVEKLTPISTEMLRLLKYPDEIDNIILEGSKKANDLAKPVLKETKEIIGFLSSY
ncbi:tryptophan--tRNA ligase [Alphaproteobacteria bacterium]|nr:tryptophan--tRNA ligase [Alphaproteobacteria bacterium]